MATLDRTIDKAYGEIFLLSLITDHYIFHTDDREGIMMFYVIDLERTPWEVIQVAYRLPNWLINNRVNVWKVNTIQHAILDSYRFKFIKAGMRPDVGFFKKYNW